MNTLISSLPSTARLAVVRALRACLACLTASVILFASPIASGFTIDTSATSTSPMTGLWYNANEAGWGSAVVQQYGSIFVTMYVYDGSGNPTWYVASNCAVAGNSCSGPLYRVTGGSPPTATWNGNNKVVASVGTLTMVFSDINTGTMSYTIDGANGSKAITRDVFALAPVPGQLSSNQAALESLLLPPGNGSYTLVSNLNRTGLQVSGVNSLYAFAGFLTKSPLTNGPQTVAISAQDTANTLALPTIIPTKTLQNGVIVATASNPEYNRYTYVGSNIQVDNLASDQKTVVHSQILSNISFVPLSGLLTSAPLEFTQWFDQLFGNPASLASNAVYSAGAGYLKLTTTSNGDRYAVFDCTNPQSSVDANVVPCLTNTTLNAALTAGIKADSTTYVLSNGTISTIGGVPIWIANSPRPQSAVGMTEQYRIYFQLNNNVYTGGFTKDGTVLPGNSYVQTPATQGQPAVTGYNNYQLRLNQAAYNSIKAALTF